MMKLQVFRTHYTENPVVFPGRLARRLQQYLQGLAMKAYENYESRGIK